MGGAKGQGARAGSAVRRACARGARLALEEGWGRWGLAGARAAHHGSWPSQAALAGQMALARGLMWTAALWGRSRAVQAASLAALWIAATMFFGGWIQGARWGEEQWRVDSQALAPCVQESGARRGGCPIDAQQEA